MSYTSLWVIDKNWSGAEHCKYPNSWLMPPVVWDVLMQKYIGTNERNGVDSYLVWVCACSDKVRNERWALLNGRINNTENQTDRIMWELAGLSVFSSKDKEFVASCIDDFVRENQIINIQLQTPPVIQRFLESAARFRSLDKLMILPAALAACYYYLDSLEREFPGDTELYHKMCKQFSDLIDTSDFYVLNSIPEWQSRFAMALATSARPFKKTYIPALTFEQRITNAKLEALK